MTGRFTETELLGNSYSVLSPSNLSHHFVCWPVSQDPCKGGGDPPRAGPELGGVDRAMDVANRGDGGPWGHLLSKASWRPTPICHPGVICLFCSNSGNFFLIKKAAGLQKNNR